MRRETLRVLGATALLLAIRLASVTVERREPAG